MWPVLARPVSAFRFTLWDGSKWQLPQARPANTTAIRFNFSLVTGQKPGQETSYEVVCPQRD